jgi:hypothetical protein
VNNYLKHLLQQFVDETPLDALEMQVLVDNGLVLEFIEQDTKMYMLTISGIRAVKKGI